MENSRSGLHHEVFLAGKDSGEEMMTDCLNDIFAKCGMPLRPFDRETGISENDLNGIHITAVYLKDENSLLVRGAIAEIEDLYDPRFKRLQKSILGLNSPDFLPEGVRIGISLQDLMVKIEGFMELDCHDDNQAAQAEKLIKTVIFYGLESRRRITEKYGELEDGRG